MTVATRHARTIKRFPLLKIGSEREYDDATAVAQELMGHPRLNKADQRYLDTLIVLINDYEESHYNFDPDEVDPLEALKALMESHGMSAKDLSELLGSQSGASMIVTGKRAISAPQALRLAQRFKVDVGLFLQAR